MPVILRNEAEFERWLTASADVALALQRPLPDDDLFSRLEASGRTRWHRRLRRHRPPGLVGYAPPILSTATSLGRSLIATRDYGRDRYRREYP
jgi:hypothetical protein